MQCCYYTCRYRREECGVLKEPRCTCPPYRLPPRCKEQHQKELLDELGCDIIQGYLYSKPQPAAVIERMFLIPAAERKKEKQRQKEISQV